MRMLILHDFQKVIFSVCCLKIQTLNPPGLKVSFFPWQSWSKGSILQARIFLTTRWLPSPRQTLDYPKIPKKCFWFRFISELKPILPRKKTLHFIRQGIYRKPQTCRREVIWTENSFRSCTSVLKVPIFQKALFPKIYFDKQILISPKNTEQIWFLVSRSQYTASKLKRVIQVENQWFF